MRKLIRYILLIPGLLVVIGLITFYAYIMFTLPPIPEGTKEVIHSVIDSDIPEKVIGEAGYANSDGVKIWFEVRQPADSIKGDILCLMGIANDALSWPEYFIEPIVRSGYRVIILDYRGTGMSDWMENWDKDNPYDLDDLAADAFGVLDKLNIDKAHVLGVSMGGMVAQQMAINDTSSILSLTSMMSSGFVEDKNLPGMDKGVVLDFVKLSVRYGMIPTEANTIKLHLASRLLLMGDTKYDLDIKSIAEEILYNMRSRKGFNHQVTAQHIAAISASGSRYDDLQKLDIPTLIIHGKSDPMIPIEHGKKCAELIPNSQTLWIDGMGHDIPILYTDTILSRLLLHLNTISAKAQL